MFSIQQSKNDQVFVYIDGNNLYQNIKKYFDWSLDYEKFYIFLKEKYKTDRVYLFIGYIEQNKALYKYLSSIGYMLVFKETIPDEQGDVKGNCDTDMVLHIVKNYYENKIKNINTKAVLITADGDFASTVQFLKENNALEIVLAPCPPVAYFPNGKKYNPMSFLIRKLRVPIFYISKYEQRLQK